EPPGKAPQQPIVKIALNARKQRDILITQRSYFIQPHRKLFTRDLPLFGPETHIEPPVPGTVGPFSRFDVYRYHSLSAVKRDAVDQRDYRRDDILTTDACQFRLYTVRIADPFDPQLVVHAENDRPAVGIRERNYPLGDPLRIRKLYL